MQGACASGLCLEYVHLHYAVDKQRAIVEALDNAKTIREAKLVYEGLTRSLNKKSLSEGTRKVLGSSSKPTRSGSSTVNESAQTNRWATLAGIKTK